MPAVSPAVLYGPAKLVVFEVSVSGRGTVCILGWPLEVNHSADP